MNKIIVITCANKKNGAILEYGGEKINFCANPSIAPDKTYYHPDQKMPSSTKTWREWVDSMQDKKDLLEAYKLYANPLYQKLYDKYQENFFIFSAGWGL